MQIIQLISPEMECGDITAENICLNRVFGRTKFEIPLRRKGPANSSATVAKRPSWRSTCHMTVSMDVEINTKPPEEEATEVAVQATVDTERDNILNFLTHNETVFFKSQQKWEADLTSKEKSDIARDIFESSKLNFLMRFGKHLKLEHLKYFEQFTEICEPDNAEIGLILKDLHRSASDKTSIDVKNRRYAALLEMIPKDSYFSEIEMMKRNPLLYEQLVGQHLTIQEKKERDKYKLDDDVTFVKILMEGIERDMAEVVRKNQEETEDNQMEEEDTSDEEDDKGSRSESPVPSYSRWGEFEDTKPIKPRLRNTTPLITAEERKVLKEEFITTMYQSFLDGKDEDFNYESVDNNVAYDDITQIEHDEEDKYFAEEDFSQSEMEHKDESSEDELDIYMNALNQHPSVCQLSNDMERL
ncbi:hypothetical protein NQ317_007532 [Molorchus minor]|uniref:CCD97-like C-terminal domain-containing protein n=1 Tax=Molorchus minor TaxID=1323400 RepID=A0ABQ9K5S2_9CUCU|nr:hypothetical protein NQ317_007532 [Molorchus minor]